MSLERGWDRWSSARPWMIIENFSDEDGMYGSPRYFTSEGDLKRAIETKQIRPLNGEIYYVSAPPQKYESEIIHKWVKSHE